jgi:hypothetical protein
MMEISLTENELSLLTTSVGFFLQVYPEVAKRSDTLQEGSDVHQMLENDLAALYKKLQDAKSST